MMPNYEELPALDEAQLRNFYALNSSVAEDGALRLCEIADYAEKLVQFLLPLSQMDMAPSDVLLLLRDAAEEFYLQHAKADTSLLSEMEELQWQLKNLLRLDGVLLVSALLEKLAAAGVHLSEEDFAGTEDVLPIYSYVKNALSDEAYEVITENLPDARVRYVGSFAEAARLLLVGEVGYCLFPIEEKGGMRLPAVENLLFSSSLCIHRILPVFGPDGLSEMKYALVSRSVHVESYKDEDDRYLEFNFAISDHSPTLSTLLCAIELFGLSLYRIHTVSYERDAQREDSYTLVVRSQGGPFLSLMVYLTLFFDDFRIIGIYKNLEA